MEIGQVERLDVKSSSAIAAYCDLILNSLATVHVGTTLGHGGAIAQDTKCQAGLTVEMHLLNASQVGIPLPDDRRITIADTTGIKILKEVYFAAECSAVAPRLRLLNDLGIKTIRSPGMEHLGLELYATVIADKAQFVDGDILPVGTLDAMQVSIALVGDNLFQIYSQHVAVELEIFG